MAIVFFKINQPTKRSGLPERFFRPIDIMINKLYNDGLSIGTACRCSYVFFPNFRSYAVSNLQPISDDKQSKRGWQFKLNGVVVNVSHMELTNPKFGTFEYGATPAGYDSWCFEEVGGGGSVIVPYSISAGGGVLIGVIEEDRYTMGGKTWNLPRGFLDSKETHFQAAKREAAEEIGFNLAERFRELPGEPANWNSAFSITRSDDKGVRFFGLEVLSDELEPAERPGTWRLRQGLLKPVSKTAEKIFGSLFIGYDKALKLRDLFTLAGVGRLLPTVRF